MKDSKSGKNIMHPMSSFIPPRIEVEESFNEYVKEFGGELVSELIEKSPPFDNADYLFRSHSIGAELKCLEKDAFQDSNHKKKMGKLYDKWVRQGDIPNTILRPPIIETRNLPEKCQLEATNLIKQPIQSRIKKANNQIKSTKAHFNLPDAKGLLLLVNDGNYSLESQAVMYLVDRIIKAQYTGIHSVIYFTVNMPARVSGVDRDVLVWVDMHRDLSNSVPREFLNALREGWFSFFARKLKQDIPVIRNMSNENLENIKFIKEPNVKAESSKGSKKGSEK